jgi:hypothetical protein
MYWLFTALGVVAEIRRPPTSFGLTMNHAWGLHDRAEELYTCRGGLQHFWTRIGRLKRIELPRCAPTLLDTDLTDETDRTDGMSSESHLA